MIYNWWFLMEGQFLPLHLSSCVEWISRSVSVWSLIGCLPVAPPTECAHTPESSNPLNPRWWAHRYESRSQTSRLRETITNSKHNRNDLNVSEIHDVSPLMLMREWMVSRWSARWRMAITATSDPDRLSLNITETSETTSNHSFTYTHTYIYNIKVITN